MTITTDEVYEAIRDSGHYLVKADWETFALLGGRPEFAPDWDAVTAHLNKSDLREITKTMQDAIFGTQSTPPVMLGRKR